MLFEGLAGPRWKEKKGWLGRAGTPNQRGVEPFSCHPSLWTGVSTDMGHITALHLANLGAEGKVKGLEPLLHLISLDLSWNQVHEIPMAIAMLKRLEILKISAAGMRGPLPKSLPISLRELDLRHNSLEGEIPEAILKCKKLSVLNLGQNCFTGGIPGAIGQLVSLRELRLSCNLLTGAIPPLPLNLQILDLSRNKLDGSFPKVGELAKLRELRMSNNQLTGTLTGVGLGELTTLVMLYAADNRLRGPLPPELFSLKELRFLNLQRNHLEGAVPATIGNLDKLVALVLCGNKLVSPLPSTLARLSKLSDMAILSGTPSRMAGVKRGFTKHGT
ncbi:unnamed protein product [Chrysoparadoxa australica]